MLGLAPMPRVPADRRLTDAITAALRTDQEAGSAGLDSLVAAISDALPDARAQRVESLEAALISCGEEAVRRQLGLEISAEVTAATLSDVGSKIESYGADVDIPWLIGLLRGDVITLGRLQFERRATADGRAMHIPEDGPLDPERVERSIAECRALFGSGTITCTSWLLDPNLRALPSGSNIVSFAARFDVAPAASGTGHSGSGDAAVAKFVFRRPLAEVLDPSVVVPATSLERLVAGHLRSGRHWTEPRGVLRE